jgi:hypothetical protein
MSSFCKTIFAGGKQKTFPFTLKVFLLFGKTFQVDEEEEKLF